VIILVWVITGIVMVLPANWLSDSQQISQEKVNIMGVDIAPSQVADRLGVADLSELQIADITLVKVLNKFYYRVSLDDGSIHLVDAQSGKVFRINQPIAEQIVLNATGSTDKISSIIRMKEHDFRYPYGPLPVYRIKLEGDGGPIYYVSGDDGNLVKNTRLSQFKTLNHQLHNFGMVKRLINHEPTRIGLLLLFTAITIVVSLTGYYLAILPVLRKKAKSVS
jgi:hypothetical protein